VGKLNFRTLAQIRNGLIGWSFEIPASAYCHRYGALVFDDKYKTNDLNK